MEPWYGRGESALEELRGIDPARILVFDTETTGLDPDEDEVLQFSACDGNGDVLMNEHFGTESKEEWPGAEAVNGISPEDVAGKPPFRTAAQRVQELVDGSDLVVAYNYAFDSKFLEAAGVRLSGKPVFDAMIEYAPVGGRWNAVHDEFKWAKLADAAGSYGITFDAHDASNDARATAALTRALIFDGNERGYAAVVREGPDKAREWAMERPAYLGGGKWEDIPRIAKAAAENPWRHELMLLDRMRTDCEYFLGNGFGSKRHIWAGSVESQAAAMRSILGNIPEDERPDWMDERTIAEYERAMLLAREIAKSFGGESVQWLGALADVRHDAARRGLAWPTADDLGGGTADEMAAALDSMVEKRMEASGVHEDRCCAISTAQRRAVWDARTLTGAGFSFDDRVGPLADARTAARYERLTGAKMPTSGLVYDAYRASGLGPGEFADVLAKSVWLDPEEVDEAHVAAGVPANLAELAFAAARDVVAAGHAGEMEEICSAAERFAANAGSSHAGAPERKTRAHSETRSARRTRSANAAHAASAQVASAGTRERNGKEAR